MKHSMEVGVIYSVMQRYNEAVESLRELMLSPIFPFTDRIQVAILQGVTKICQIFFPRFFIAGNRLRAIVLKLINSIR